METKTKRFTLDLELSMQRRLKVTAALKGISMRQYCLFVIERELSRDEVEGARKLPFGEEALNRLKSLQAGVFHGQKVSGDSTDLILEAREIRVKA